METSAVQSTQSLSEQQQSRSICLPNQTALIKEMQNMRHGPSQRDDVLSGEHVPILGNWHFQTHYRSHYTIPRQTASCQNSVRCSRWLHLQGIITVLCICAHLSVSIFETVLTRTTAPAICSKMLSEIELCDPCFLTGDQLWPVVILQIMTTLAK